MKRSILSFTATFACLMLLLAMGVSALGQDYDFYMFPEPLPTMTVPATYKFVDNRPWTDEEKKVVREALREWDVWICNTQTFVEVTGDTWDLSLRWGGSDLFRNWRDVPGYNYPGWDLTTANAMWTPDTLNPPWDTNTYPKKEIYFNSTRPWYVDPDPTTDEPVPVAKYDLLTIAKHEIGHGLGIKGDWGNTNVWPTPPAGTSSDEVMWDVTPKGVRKHLKPSDIEALRALNTYHVVPEPSALLALGSGLIALAGAAIRRRR